MALKQNIKQSTATPLVPSLCINYISGEMWVHLTIFDTMWALLKCEGPSMPLTRPREGVRGMKCSVAPQTLTRGLRALLINSASLWVTGCRSRSPSFLWGLRSQTQEDVGQWKRLPSTTIFLDLKITWEWGSIAFTSVPTLGRCWEDKALSLLAQEVKRTGDKNRTELFRIQVRTSQGL